MTREEIIAKYPHVIQQNNKNDTMEDEQSNGMADNQQ